MVGRRDSSEFYLDAVEMSYRRLHQAAETGSRDGGGGSTVAVAGLFDDDVTVYDLTNTRMPVVLTGELIEPDADGLAVTFAARGGAMPFVVATPAACQGPVGMSADLTSHLSDPPNPGRYVIVAGPGMEGEADALAA